MRWFSLFFLFVFLLLLCFFLFQDRSISHQSLWYFQEAEASLLKGCIEEGEVLLQQGLFLLYRSLHDQEDLDILPLFGRGKEVYLLARDQKGELREVTEGLFLLLFQSIQKILNEREKENSSCINIPTCV